jgi:hypothetical protein
LYAKGALAVGTPASTDAVQAGGVSNIIKRVRILAKSETRLDVLGKELRILNLLHNQSSFVQTDPAVNAAAPTFEVCLTRQFEMPRMIFPHADRGILPNNLIRDIQVVVDVGLPADVLKTAGTNTWNGATIEFYVLQAIPTPIDPAFYLNEQYVAPWRDNVALTSVGDYDRLVPTGGKYRHLIVYAEKTVSGLISYDDTLVSQLVLKSNRTDIFRQNWNSIKADNVQNFLLTSKLSGVAVLDWTRYFTPPELMDADRILRENGADLHLVTTCGATAAASTLGVVALRVFGAF